MSKFGEDCKNELLKHKNKNGNNFEFNKEQQLKANYHLGRYIAFSCHALSLFENDDFKEYINCINPNAVIHVRNSI